MFAFIFIYLFLFNLTYCLYDIYVVLLFNNLFMVYDYIVMRILIVFNLNGIYIYI